VHGRPSTTHFVKTKKIHKGHHAHWLETTGKLHESRFMSEEEGGDFGKRLGLTYL